MSFPITPHQIPEFSPLSFFEPHELIIISASHGLSTWTLFLCGPQKLLGVQDAAAAPEPGAWQHLAKALFLSGLNSGAVTQNAESLLFKDHLT